MMEGAFILVGSTILAWLLYHYGYNSEKMMAARAWQRCFKELRERVSAFTKETSDDTAQHLFNDLHSAYSEFMPEANRAIDEARFFWIKNIYHRLIDEADETMEMWSKRLRSIYSDETSS